MAPLAGSVAAHAALYLLLPRSWCKVVLVVVVDGSYIVAGASTAIEGISPSVFLSRTKKKRIGKTVRPFMQRRHIDDDELVVVLTPNSKEELVPKTCFSVALAGALYEVTHGGTLSTIPNASWFDSSCTLF
jgi:hypothetical protein